ncbi:MAG: hypothetical protein IKN17_13660 [Ruminococcus sp.]|nr:hypothetical protein [Ruminococcus sp.]
MNEELTLTDIIAGYLTACGISCETEVIGGREAVTIRYGEGEYLPEDCSVTVEEPAEGVRAVRLLMTVFSGLTAEQTADLRRVIGKFNRYLDIGCFILPEEDVLFYSYAFVIEDQLPAESLLSALTASLDAATDGASQGKRLLMPLITGELTCQQIIDRDIFPAQGGE